MANVFQSETAVESERINRINFPPLRRAFWTGIQLFCFLFYFAAFAVFGANEIPLTYYYKGFDTNGHLLVEGVINVRVGETNRVKGDWQLQVLDKGKLKELGPQDGSGEIAGQLKNERIFLNLNPEEFGDNIYLDGKVTKANIFKIKGKWGHYGYYQGKLNEGIFEMVRRKDPPKKLQ